ncbi:response regulator [Pelagicoccus mobilis]|uniref:Response regulator n=1 Tax=Pelagicoccus mobilis TaxID=415221 RepID=A0A934RXI0_9BACT|nr:response regulator [Pelagicoccus mobilis]MBK1876177.1 response regulator [Pelagicoccus mobilis]
MNQIYILCVDDEADVLEAVERDLATMEEVFPLEIASSADEARQVLERIDAQGAELGLIFCDHVMPKETGGEFLSWLDGQPQWKRSRKALLTGQAGLEATVSAINNAGLDFYVSKPWTQEGLLQAAKRLLTDYVISRNIDPLPYMSILDATRLAEHSYKRGLISDT